MGLLPHGPFCRICGVMSVVAVILACLAEASESTHDSLNQKSLTAHVFAAFRKKKVAKP